MRGPDTPDALIFARKILAGVARAGGGVSRSIIVAMLVGRSTPGVRDRGLEDLSTFGILEDHAAETVADGLAALCNAGLIGRWKGGLSRRGWEVMVDGIPLGVKAAEQVLRALRRERRRLRKLQRAIEE